MGTGIETSSHKYGLFQVRGFPRLLTTELPTGNYPVDAIAISAHLPVLRVDNLRRLRGGVLER